MTTLKAALAAILLLACSAVLAFKPEIGEPPASLAQHVEYVDGKPLDLGALKGKPAVLYFGADWCVPCQLHGRPATIEVARKYAKEGLQVVFVSMDDNRARQAKMEEAASIDYMKIAMPRLSVCAPGKCPDGLRDLGDFGRIYGYPSAFVLDKNGLLVEKIRGGSAIRHQLEDAVRPVLK